jgi:hypothetical protein
MNPVKKSTKLDIEWNFLNEKKIDLLNNVLIN